jgi:hypothetical protein
LTCWIRADHRVTSQILEHDSIETTLHFYIHASANAEQRIGAMMNARWTTNSAPASNRA